MLEAAMKRAEEARLKDEKRKELKKEMDMIKIER